MTFRVLIYILLTTGVISEIWKVTKENFPDYFKTTKGSIFLYVTTENCDLCDMLYFKFVIVSQIFIKSRKASFGRVQDSVLAKVFGITSFPEIVYYEEGNASPQIYTGDITPKALFIHVASAMKIDPTRIGVKYTTELTISNFNKIMKTDKQHRLVMLHKSDDILELDGFDELAEIFQNELEIIMATINVEKQKRLKLMYQTEKYPAIYWYPKDTVDKKKRYGGEFDINDMVYFINNECKFQRLKDGTLNSQAGLIESLDFIITEHVKDLNEITNLALVKMKLTKAITKLPVEYDIELAEFYVHLVDELEEDRTVDVLSETRNRIYRQMLGAGPYKLDQLYRMKNIIQKVIYTIGDHLIEVSGGKKKRQPDEEDRSKTDDKNANSVIFHEEF